jgi:hypothetical protein
MITNERQERLQLRSFAFICSSSGRRNKARINTYHPPVLRGTASCGRNLEKIGCEGRKELAHTAVRLQLILFSEITCAFSI